jgi:hypothetical protein
MWSNNIQTTINNLKKGVICTMIKENSCQKHLETTRNLVKLEADRIYNIERNRKWNHSEAGRKYKREYMRKYYALHRDKINKYNKDRQKTAKAEKNNSVLYILEQKFNEIKTLIRDVKVKETQKKCKHSFNSVDVNVRPWVCKKCGFEY